jgi:hypothetical protein
MIFPTRPSRQYLVAGAARTRSSTGVGKRAKAQGRGRRKTAGGQAAGSKPARSSVPVVLALYEAMRDGRVEDALALVDLEVAYKPLAARWGPVSVSGVCRHVCQCR